MSDKKRIIELVEKGVLSTDEALKLLENLAEKEAELSEELNFETEKVISAEDKEVKPVSDTSTEKVASEEKTEKVEKEEKENSEKSEKVKKLTAQKEKLEKEIKVLQEKQTELKEETTEIKQEIDELTSKVQNQIDELEMTISDLEKEIELVQSVHEEVDTSDELVELYDQLSTKQRELEKVEAEQMTQKPVIESAEEDLEKAKGELAEVTEELGELKKELHCVNMQIWSTKASAAVESLEIPESIDETVTEAGNVVGSMVTKIGGLVSETVDKISDSIGDIEWEDAKKKIKKGAVSKTVEKEWTFDDSEITILDFKNANGYMKFYQTDEDKIRVEAKMRLLGLQEDDVEEALEKRMEIEESQGKLQFHIPNKRVQAQLKIWLPKRTYDYISLRSLNGDISFEPMKAKDITLTTTNGKINFDHLEATLLELKGTNGDITLKDTQLRDLIVSTVNGDVRVIGDVQSSQVSTVNGTIRQTLLNEDIIRVTNQTVNGTIKLAIPESMGIEGRAQTTFGNIYTRLSQFGEQPVKDGKVRNLDIMRAGENYVDIEAKTVSGSIYLKDNENN